MFHNLPPWIACYICRCVTPMMYEVNFVSRAGMLWRHLVCEAHKSNTEEKQNDLHETT